MQWIGLSHSPSLSGVGVNGSGPVIEGHPLEGGYPPFPLAPGTGTGHQKPELESASWKVIILFFIKLS